MIKTGEEVLKIKCFCCDKYFNTHLVESGRPNLWKIKTWYCSKECEIKDAGSETYRPRSDLL